MLTKQGFRSVSVVNKVCLNSSPNKMLFNFWPLVFVVHMNAQFGQNRKKMYVEKRAVIKFVSKFLHTSELSCPKTHKYTGNCQSTVSVEFMNSERMLMNSHQDFIELHLRMVFMQF